MNMIKYLYSISLKYVLKYQKFFQFYFFLRISVFFRILRVKLALIDRIWQLSITALEGSVKTDPPRRIMTSVRSAMGCGARVLRTGGRDWLTRGGIMPRRAGGINGMAPISNQSRPMKHVYRYAHDAVQTSLSSLDAYALYSKAVKLPSFIRTNRNRLLFRLSTQFLNVCE